MRLPQQPDTPDPERGEERTVRRGPLLKWSLVLALAMLGLVLYFLHQHRVAPLLG